jgi:cation:H+ antiporter
MGALFLLLGGGVLLYFGAQWLVGGSSSLALALRVPPLIVGLTVVAYGTSTPEIVVSVKAALSGHADVALGNVIGSNIANVGLILGLAALVAPARVDRALSRRELPVLLVSALAVPLLLLDGVIAAWEGALLLLSGVAYTAWMVHSARTESLKQALSDVAAEEEAADAAGAPEQQRGWKRAAATALAGLAALVVGGSLFVDGAVLAAKALGLSERLIGLTIVAVGTSLPELVTSLLAARRGHSDLAIGNVVGSNIFNVLLCLGAAGLSGTVKGEPTALWFELAALLVMTALAAFLIRDERVINRVEGGVALTLFVGFVALSVARG